MTGGIAKYWIISRMDRGQGTVLCKVINWPLVVSSILMLCFYIFISLVNILRKSVDLGEVPSMWRQVNVVKFLRREIKH